MPGLFLANATNKTRGVAIYFSKRVSFSHVQEIRDPEGRFVLVKGLVGEQFCSIISYYAPNVSQAAFFIKLLCALTQYLKGQVICGGGGDTNLALELSVGKSNPRAFVSEMDS